MNKMLDRDRTCAQIKRTCSDHGITVDCIVEKMNVSRQTVYSWFSSKKMPSIDHIIELADLLDVTVDELLVRKEYRSDG